MATATATAHGPKALAKEWDPAYYHGRRSKPARERVVGMDLTRRDGIERSVRMDIDHLADTYEKTILNPDGTPYEHRAERLRDHTGRGSDKPMS